MYRNFDPVKNGVKAKRDSEKLDVENRAIELAVQANSPATWRWLQKLYLSLISEAVKRFDTRELNRILSLYKGQSCKIAYP